MIGMCFLLYKTHPVHYRIQELMLSDPLFAADILHRQNTHLTSRMSTTLNLQTTVNPDTEQDQLGTVPSADGPMLVSGCDEQSRGTLDQRGSDVMDGTDTTTSAM